MRVAGAVMMVLATLPFSVLLLKAKGWLCLVATFLPMAGIVVAVAGATRLAKPHSWWARHLYRDAVLLRARRRYEDAPDTPDTLLAGLGWLLLALVVALGALYAVGVVDP